MNEQTAIELINKLTNLVNSKKTKNLIVTSPDKDFCYKIEKIQETETSILLITDGEIDLLNT